MNLPAWISELPETVKGLIGAVFAAAMAVGKDVAAAEQQARQALSGLCAQGTDGAWALSGAAAEIGGQKVLHFRAARQADASGLLWEAVLIEPGLSKGWPKFFWTDDLFVQDLAKFDGIDVNAYELTADVFGHLPVGEVSALEDIKRYLISKKVGMVEKHWHEPGVGVKALIRFGPEHQWLVSTLRDGASRGLDVLGLSIDARVKGFEVAVDGERVVWPTEIVAVSSVDVVTRPAAGGKFIRAVMGQTEDSMKKVLEMIQQARPDLLAGKDVATLNEAEIMVLARQAMELKPAQAADKKDDTNAGITADQVKAMLGAEIQQSEQRAACGLALDRVLATSELPALAAARVRGQFAGQVFDPAVLDAAVKAEKDYLAAMAAPGTMPGLSGGDGVRSGVSVGLGSLQKIQLATDRIFGFGKDEIMTMAQMSRLDGQPQFADLRAAQGLAADYDSLPRLKGLRELYVLLSGDPDISGRFNRAGISADLRAAQDFTSATFTYVLGNTMARRMVRDYRTATYGEEALISIRKSVPNFKTQEAIKVGYFGDLDTVDPESGDYQEVAGVTDEESPYSIAQKGNLLTISRKMILGDDLSVVERLVSKLGRAARRTHAKYVWNFFIGNAVCSDTTAWFTSGHGNLTTSAMDFDTVLAGFIALAKMAEKDSGERIGWDLGGTVKPVLVYPIDLMSTAEKIISDDEYYTTNDLTTKTRNPLKGKITGMQIPLLTDATDWGLILPPNEVDIVEMGYLNGNQEPEMFVADAPTSEQMFVGDRLRHKIRHEYGGALVSYESGYKGIVA